MVAVYLVSFSVEEIRDLLSRTVTVQITVMLNVSGTDWQAAQVQRRDVCPRLEPSERAFWPGQVLSYPSERICILRDGTEEGLRMAGREHDHRSEDQGKRSVFGRWEVIY